MSDNTIKGKVDIKEVVKVLLSEESYGRTDIIVPRIVLKDLLIEIETLKKRVENMDITIACYETGKVIDWKKIEDMSLQLLRVREILWLNHGHSGLYGDDGEMQCGLCAVNSYPEKLWDYKRTDIVSLTKKAMAVLITQISKKEDF